MNGKRFVKIVSSSIVVTCMLAHDDQSGQNKARELALYDRAGPFSVGRDKIAEDPDGNLAVIRQFLWEHWHKQRLGHLVATFYSKEGEPSTHSFFIEPDVTGHWIVHVETKSVSYSRRPGSRRRRYANRWSVYNTIERTEPLKDGMSSPVLVPEQETRQPEAYWLRLRNQRTGEQTTL